MTTRSERPGTRQQTHRPSLMAACETCRRLKMRCIRPNTTEGSKDPTEPCERCRRNNRTCSIPSPRPLGRKPGAVGRYRGFEKAYRKMQAELKKAPAAAGEIHEGADHMSNGKGEVLDHLLSNMQNNTNHEESQSNRPTDGRTPSNQYPSSHASPTVNVVESPVTEQIQAPTMTTSAHGPNTYTVTSDVNREPVSNPLALLADASGAAQALEMQPELMTSSPASNFDDSGHGQSSSSQSIGRYLLHRPGYISLGLQLSRDSLESGLDALFAPPPPQTNRYSDYFRPPDGSPPRDVGPDLDPVELGLISMTEAHALFPIYFARLHTFNGILDPMLHTVDYVRSQSSLLFTWILALTAQFDHGSAAIAKRLRLHGERLSRHVHTCGYKSVEIVQGYYISLLSATPAKTLSEERSWVYTMYAFGVAAELGLDQGSRLRPHHGATNSYSARSSPPDATVNPHSRRYVISGPARQDPEQPYSSNPTTYHSFENPTYLQRLARNRERTWLRILLWERANSAACGRMNAFPETELVYNIESWWMHPLADSTDKHTCAFILLRCHLASLHTKLRGQAAVPHSDPHWVRELIDTTFEPWQKTWLPAPDATLPPSERLPSLYLYYVYIHNRLWTLSFALYSVNSNRDLSAIREDCFEAAVHCCEVAVRDLQKIGEPLYCMLAPTWAMISYAAVLALKIFPCLHGSRQGYEAELLALLAQVALQLERAGTTPSHRLGIAALLGQHLLMILRTKAAGLADAIPVAEDQTALVYKHNNNNNNTNTNSGCQATGNASTNAGTMEMPSDTHFYDPLLSTYDPFLTTAMVGTENDPTGEGFADLFRELFGPRFGEFF